MLFDLATAAGLEEKRNKMASGAHINATEDRAGKLLSNVRIMGCFTFAFSYACWSSLPQRQESLC